MRRKGKEIWKKGRGKRSKWCYLSFSSRGFSLVELIIALGVIVLMLGAISPVIVSQYRKGQVGKTIATIETLREAVGQYVEMTGAVSFTGISIAELTSKRIIPGSFANEKNPWGGVYSLSSNDGSTYTITLTTVPKWAGEDYLESTYSKTSTYNYNTGTQALTLTFY